MNTFNHPYSFKFHFSLSETERGECGRDLIKTKRHKLINWKTGFFFDQVGYELFRIIFAALYIVYIGLLLFISYGMHLVELRCSKSASL